MNWMGGARNRVKYQGERRIQQEFFERQKLASAQSIPCKTPAKIKRGLSQDLVALHTVSRINSGVPDGAKRKRPIKKLDLEKFHSCTRQIDEVDIGPCSPLQTPSKLLLSDGKLDNKPGCMKPTNDTDNKPSKELLPNHKHIHRYCSQFSIDYAKEDQREKSYKSPLLSFENKKENSDIDVTHKQPNEFIFSKPDKSSKNNTVKAKFDPYVSEDFQVTPLVRYTKKHPPGNIGLDKSKKRKHSDGTNAGKKIDGTTERKGSHNFNEPYFSSTPISDFYSVRSDMVAKREHFGPISPILKDVTFSEARPMKVASREKRDDLGASQYPVQGRITTEAGTNQFNSDISYIVSQHSNENSKDFTYQKEIHEYNHGLSCLKNNWRNQKKVTNNGLNSSSLQFDSLSKYDLTENIFDNSLSGDSHIQGSEHEISGSLARYRNITRHTDDRESPFLHISSFIEQEDLSKKIKLDNRFKSSVSKPNFEDCIEEELPHRPMKTMSMKMAPELINMHQKFGHGEDFRTGNSYCMSENTVTAASRLQGGLVQNILSPFPGEEFPKHLLSPSKQLQEEIDHKLSEIIAEERKNSMPLGIGTVGNRQTMNRSQNDSARLYKTMKNHITDVLTEMKHLEEQDSVSPEAPFDKVPMSTSIESPGAVTTESFEADAYLVSEEVLLSADIEYIQDKEIWPNNETSLSSADIEVKKKAGYRCTVEIQSGNHNNITLSRTLERNRKYGPEIDRASDASFESCLVGDKKIVKGIINNESPGKVSDENFKDTKTKKRSEPETEVLGEIGTDCLPETSAKDGIPETYRTEGVPKADGTDHNLETEGTDNKLKTNGNDHKPDIDEKGGVPETVEADCLPESDGTVNKLETDRTGLSQLQVAEISSGKNQFTQTTAVANFKKSLVEVSTSPIQEFNTVQGHVDVGVQCELNLFPKLSYLAGKCFKVKPVRNSTPS